MESTIESQLVVIGIMLVLFVGLMLFVWKNSEEMSKEKEMEKGELIHTWYERTDMYIYEHKIYEYAEETIVYERVS